MKYSFLLLLVLISMGSNAQNNATLFSYGGTPVKTDEFISIYKKNNMNKEPDYSKEAVYDYLKLYENFKLKVTEGKAIKIDTLPSIQSELATYRKQLSKSYSIDKPTQDRLIKEAIDRSGYDVMVAHIVIKCSLDATAKDSLDAYTKILKARDRIVKGKEDFGIVAKDVSEDPNTKNIAGEIGYITALQTIYAFETAAYSTKAGEVSMPVRTKIGYHLIKVLNKRVNRGQVQVKHVLSSTPKNANADQVAKAKAKIEYWQKLVNTNKITFDELARDSSDDKISAADGGRVPFFGTGKMVAEFEDAAFSLVKKGDIAPITKTDYGFHLIMLDDKKNATTVTAEEMKKTIEKDVRNDEAKKATLVKTRANYGFVDFLPALNTFTKQLDSSILKGTYLSSSNNSNVTLFTLDNKNYTTKDFANFLELTQRTFRPKAAISAAEFGNRAYTTYLDKITNELFEQKLEVRYPEYKSLMEEYADGIILFEITDRQVWSKAVNDTMGLRKYHTQNQNKYMWGTRTHAIIYTCSDSATYLATGKLLSKGKPANMATIQKKINVENHPNAVLINEGNFEKGQNATFDKCNTLAPGVYSVEREGVLYWVHILNEVLPMAKTLDEARGYIIADYQDFLEKTWLDELRTKYPIVENQAAINAIIK
jgi:peptidyl-prolyl cis-trans isomerase SurA